jgi:hypothetical protein
VFHRLFSIVGDYGLNIFANGYPTSLKIVCNTTAPVDAIEETVTAGSSSLSYDSLKAGIFLSWVAIG